MRSSRVSDQDKLPLGIGLEDLLQQDFSYTQRLLNIAEVQWPSVEATKWIGLVNEIHIVPCDLLRGSGQVVEVEIRYVGRPISVDLGHVHPWRKWSSKRIQKTLLWCPDFGDTKDIVDVGDDCQTCVRYKICRCIARISTRSVDIRNLNLLCGVPSNEALGLDGNKSVEISL